MIELSDGYRIEADSLNYTLKKTVKGVSKQGEPIERDEIKGYYGTLESTLRAFGNNLVLDGVKDGSYTLTEALSIVSEAREKVENLIREYVAI